MGKSREETYGAEGRGDFLYIDPERLTLVSDKSHPLYDDRVHLPLVENMVLSIMTAGVKVAIAIRLNGKDSKDRPIVEVVDGRQRTKNAREANKRLKKAGQDIKLVKCIPEKGEDADFISTMIIMNEFKQERSVMSRVRLLKRLLDAGKTQPQAAITLGVSTGTIANYLRLLDCDTSVQEAVDKNLIPAEAAKRLATMNRDEQKVALDSMVAVGATKGRTAIQAAEQASQGRRIDVSNTEGPRMRNRVFIEWVRDATKDMPLVSATLGYILGDEKALDAFPLLKTKLEGHGKKTRTPREPKVPGEKKLSKKRIRREVESLD